MNLPHVISPKMPTVERGTLLAPKEELHESLRSCVAVWEALSAALGRPACVLDMKCAHGEIVLELAERGAHAVGIDACADNIALCESLATKRDNLSTRFVQADLEEFFETADLRNLDLVIGFDVFGEIVRNHDAAKVAAWFDRLAEHVPVVLLDMRATDADKRNLLESFLFVHEVARNGASGGIQFASKRYYYFGDKLAAFTHTTKNSHPAHDVQFGGTRRYYRDENVIAKVFALRDYQETANRNEITREAAFLMAPPPGFAPLPRLHAHAVTEHEAWIVRDRLPGCLLSEAIRTQEPFDDARVIRAILNQLVVLEANGWYHNDLRAWNVLLQPDQTATLIDYGSITTEAKNTIWPSALFPAFWLFVWCVATRSPWSGDMYAPPFISPYNLPDPYCGWALRSWRQAPETWTFASLAETFDEAMASTETVVLAADQLWIAESEKYMHKLNRTIFRLYSALTNRLTDPPSDGF